MALSSAIWFVCRDMFSEVHQLNFGSVSWEWSAWWDWMISFPWIPAIYTGVFSTGLCLWAEVSYLSFFSSVQINLSPPPKKNHQHESLNLSIF